VGCGIGGYGTGRTLGHGVWRAEKDSRHTVPDGNLKSGDNDTGNSGYDTKNLKFCDLVF